MRAASDLTLWHDHPFWTSYFILRTLNFPAATMNDRSTYPMSALFLLVTMVAVLLAIASSAGTEWLVKEPLGPVIAMVVGAVLGPIVMAYVTLRWEMLVMSYFVGVGVSFVAIRLLIWPNDLRIVLGGAAVLLAYGIVIRLTHPRPTDATPH
jgi:hypothetical protein